MRRVAVGRAIAARTREFLVKSGPNAPRLRAGGLLALSVAVALGGCASGGSAPTTRVTPMFPESQWGVAASQRVVSETTPIPKGGGVYKVGTPYQVGGKWYDPREQPDYDRVGIASWYGADFHGRRTGNGEIYDMRSLTAAHPTLPMPSYAYVTSLANGRTILVRVNDRGPYVADRIIDLSRASADALDLKTGGTGRVRVRYAGPAPLDGNDARERQYLASRPWSGASRYASAASGWTPAPRTSVAQGWSVTDDTGAMAPAPRGWSSQRASASQSWAGETWSERRAYASEDWSPAAYRAGLATR